MNVEETIKGYIGEDGKIDGGKISDIVKAINTAVGKEFVEKKRYNDKLTEIDTLKSEKAAAEDNATISEQWKVKYDAIKEDFDTYKTTVASEKTHEEKKKAYRELLKGAGVSEKRLETVLKCSKSEIDSLEIDKDGKVKDSDKFSENIKTEWADFIVSEGVEGSGTGDQYKGSGDDKKLDSMSMADYIAARKNQRR